MRARGKAIPDALSHADESRPVRDSRLTHGPSIVCTMTVVTGLLPRRHAPGRVSRRGGNFALRVSLSALVTLRHDAHRRRTRPEPRRPRLPAGRAGRDRRHAVERLGRAVVIAALDAVLVCL